MSESLDRTEIVERERREQQILLEDSGRSLEERLKVPVASSSKVPAVYREKRLFSMVPEDPELVTALSRLESIRERKELEERITQEQKAELEQAIFRQMEFEDRMTPELAYPYTVRAVWRVVVFWAWTRGYLSSGKSLRESLGVPGTEDPDLWETYECWPAPSPGASYAKAHRRDIVPILPAEPWISRWLELLEEAVRKLDLRRGTEENPREGVWGVMYLQRDPVLYFPHFEHVFLWDELLIEDCQKLLRSSKSFTANYLKRNYSLKEFEINHLIRAAAVQIENRHSMSLELKTAIMEDRLESILEDPGADPKTRVQVLRVLATVQGLGNTKPDENFLGDLVAESEKNDA